MRRNCGERDPGTNRAPATNTDNATRQSNGRTRNCNGIPDSHELFDPDVERENHQIYRDALAVDGPDSFTRQWLDLPADDPRRVAALERAAWTHHVERLGLAVPAGYASFSAAVDREVARELKAAAWAVSGAADWTQLATESRYVDRALQRRQEALRPRPTDHPGGPVDWATGRPLRAAETAA